MEMRVVLPAPFGPRSAKISPCTISRSTPRRASNDPKRFFTLRMDTTETDTWCRNVAQAGGGGTDDTVDAMGRRSVSLSDEDRWVFNRLAQDYLTRPPYPDTLVDRLVTLAGGPGARVADLGAGTGHLALPLAARGLHVTAVEPARAMLSALEARRDPEISIVAVHASAEATAQSAGDRERCDATATISASTAKTVRTEANARGRGSQQIARDGGGETLARLAA